VRHLFTKDKLIIAIVLVLFVGSLALFWHDSPPSSDLLAGQSFNMHERLYFALSTPTGNIPFAKWEIERLLYNSEIRLPDGISISNVEVTASSAASYTIAAVDGTVVISSNIVPGRKVIRMDIPGLFGVAKSANRILTFPIGAPTFDRSNAWVIKSFDVKSNLNHTGQP
jgi:hypothetical protein